MQKGLLRFHLASVEIFQGKVVALHFQRRTWVLGKSCQAGDADESCHSCCHKLLVGRTLPTSTYERGLRPTAFGWQLTALCGGKGGLRRDEQHGAGVGRWPPQRHPSSLELVAVLLGANVPHLGNGRFVAKSPCWQRVFLGLRQASTALEYYKT